MGGAGGGGAVGGARNKAGFQKQQSEKRKGSEAERCWEDRRLGGRGDEETKYSGRGWNGEEGVLVRAEATLRLESKPPRFTRVHQQVNCSPLSRKVK